MVTGIPMTMGTERTTGMTSSTSVDLSLDSGELVILGTQYAGEMKKGVFTAMHYLMPKKGILSMHCSATEGKAGDTSILFGLSGTGKTTLSADPHRRLIGDDEHCWSDRGIFNIEGGCYAKTIGLTRSAEPEIYDAIRFGAVLENVTLDSNTRRVNFADASITENTRCAYPIEFIASAKRPCVGTHPIHVIFLTCDAFGVLPPVSKLNTAQAMYHFISGYTAKIAGTEVGVREPEATFSPCFGGPFLVWHPTKYAELLADRLREHKSEVWLVNTGWTGGPHGVGRRMSLTHTRAIIDGIHSGALSKASTRIDAHFGLEIPTSCPEVPASILDPETQWTAPTPYATAAASLCSAFAKNFKQYEEAASAEIRAGALRPAGHR